MNFERHTDPKKSMEIGIESRIQKIRKEQGKLQKSPGDDILWSARHRFLDFFCYYLEKYYKEEAEIKWGKIFKEMIRKNVSAGYADEILKWFPDIQDLSILTNACVAGHPLIKSLKPIKLNFLKIENFKEEFFNAIEMNFGNGNLHLFTRSKEFLIDGLLTEKEFLYIKNKRKKNYDNIIKNSYNCYEHY